MKASKLAWFVVLVVGWLLALSPDRAAAGSVWEDRAPTWEYEALTADYEALTPADREQVREPVIRALDSQIVEHEPPLSNDRYQPSPVYRMQTPVDRPPQVHLVPPQLRDIIDNARARQRESIAGLVGPISVDDRPRMAIEGSEPEINGHVSNWRKTPLVRLRDLEPEQPHREQPHRELPKPANMSTMLPLLLSRRDAGTPAPRVPSVPIGLLPCSPDRPSTDQACAPIGLLPCSPDHRSTDQACTP